MLLIFSLIISWNAVVHTRKEFQRWKSPYGMDLETQEQDVTTSVEEGCFSILMGADIQYPWLRAPVKGDNKEISKSMTRQYFLGMSKLTKLKTGCVVKAVIMNGDLTAFGHYHELETFKRMLMDAKKELNVPIYVGMGDQDYARNVPICDNSNCSTRMAGYMAMDLIQKASQLKNIDVVMIPGFDRPMAYSIGRSCAEPTFRILYNGSLAYSFDIGNIHFVQLQNYPSYENYWYSKVYSRNSSDYCPYKGMITFNIRSSLDWLENDLREASTQDKHIVLCFHDPCEYFKFDAGAERFKRLIIEYHVAGIFAGHFRYKHGIYRHFPKRYADVPIFACGAPIYGTFLRVIFYPRNQTMMVHGYKSLSNGEVENLHINNSTVRFRLRT